MMIEDPTVSTGFTLHTQSFDKRKQLRSHYVTLVPVFIFVFVHGMRDPGYMNGQC
jgi:hypothetical protein